MLQKILSLILCVIVILLNIGIFLYVKELEESDCDCTDHLLRNIVEYGSLVYVLYIVIIMFFILINKKLFSKINLLSVILFTIITTYYILCVVYFFKLATDPHCDCSHNWKRKILIYPLIFTPICIVTLFSILYTFFIKNNNVNRIRLNNRFNKINV